MRNEAIWEDATFAAGLLAAYRPSVFDVAITCSFPFTHWALRRPARNKPLQVFVTQNGDWPAFSDRSEFRTFACDGLVCTNPDYFERNRDRWNCALIPNGIDLQRFSVGPGKRGKFGLPEDLPVVLMVSALIESKRVLEGIRAVSELEDVFLVVAGDGPLRDEAQELASALLPGRFKRISLPSQEMPDLYRSADVFMHLSELESFGNVFLEAWGSGLAIVGHDTDRLRWILGENANFLCDTTNRHSLISALKGALASRSAGRVQLGGIERFAWPNIAAKYREFFAELMARQRLA
jgi:glycosyltransferase involved in cell wall biosynthesis